MSHSLDAEQTAVGMSDTAFRVRADTHPIWPVGLDDAHESGVDDKAPKQVSADLYIGRFGPYKRRQANRGLQANCAAY